MQVWMGWTATLAPAVKSAFTWDEWCTRQQRILGGERHRRAYQQESTPFSDRELARLTFVRWLYQTGRLDPEQNDKV